MKARSDDSDNSILPTAAYILPLIAFLVITSCYPNFAGSTGSEGTISTAAWTYVIMLIVQIVVATGLLVWFHNIYLREFPLRVSWLAVATGVVGIVLWVAFAELQLEKNALTAIGLGHLLPDRPALNPFSEFPEAGFRTLFLVLRFSVLVVIVPIVEELFIRGWLVRWVNDVNWEFTSLKKLSWQALASATVYGVLTHPAEAIAAIAWFSLVTWLMQRTGNLWDCVVAHAVTNLLLGIYVLQTGAWRLW